ncbi:ABC transporter permease subunit [Enterococcus sp. LJL51]|uniref:ABC transporter permease subunit n=1 Tax=Enterococcus sp. LJL51 TaxID=3416656 RepID=UPI003CF7BD3A
MKFEWVKWKRNPKNGLLLVLLVLVFSVQLAEHWDSSTRLGEGDYTELKAMGEEIQPPQNYTGSSEPYKMLHHLNEAGEPRSDKDKEQYQRVVSVLYLLEDENAARRNGQDELRLQLQSERLVLQIAYMEAGGTEWQLLSRKDAEKQLARNHWLMERGLTIEELTTSPKGAYFLYSFLQWWMSIGGAVLLVGFLFFDYLTSEYERSNYLLLAVQPTSRRKRYFNKMQTAAVILVVLVLGGVILSYTIASLLFGSGSINYPILIEYASGFGFIPLGEYLVKAIVLQLLYMLFLLQFLFLLSEIIRKSLEVLGVFLFLLLVPNILLPFIADAGAGRWIPFLYMDVHTYITETNGFFHSPLFSIIVLLLGNIVLWKLGVWVVKKR